MQLTSHWGTKIENYIEGICTYEKNQIKPKNNVICTHYWCAKEFYITVYCMRNPYPLAMQTIFILINGIICVLTDFCLLYRWSQLQPSGIRGKLPMAQDKNPVSLQFLFGVMTTPFSSIRSLPPDCINWQVTHRI